MADPKIIKEIMNMVTIPVMAKARIGHFVEAQVLEALGVDYSEGLGEAMKGIEISQIAAAERMQDRGW
jgi:pyridoxal biosynthesis lyase PdxS